MLTFVIAYLRVGNSSGFFFFSLPEMMGRSGGRVGRSLTDDRIVRALRRLQNVTLRGL